MTIKELRALTEKELLKELNTAKVELQKIRIGIQTKHEKNTSKAQKTKKMIARVTTMLNEIQAESAAQVSTK
ncbi:50S ribosomal protein L29 [Candidatus Peregrinibacteria bacterium]|nr:MAG: 50S ribosomal protein L29 [Candidatus Peregrinibacteria bacterium]